MSDSTFNLSKLQTIVTLLVGIGTILGGLWFTLDYFYVSREELTAFAIADQKNDQEMLAKLSELESGVLALTRIFLRGEIKALDRSIDSLEAMENRTDIEDEYLRSLKEDRIDLKDQLDEL